MTHQHKYDAQGKQLCCTQEEKIYTKAGAKDLIKEKNQLHDEHSHEHTEGDGHDHSHEGKGSVFTMFLPAVISLTLLLKSYV